MTRTCTAPTPCDEKTSRSQNNAPKACPGGVCLGRPHNRRARGFTLAELLVVLSLIALFVLLAQLNVFFIFQKNRFRSQVEDFVSTMRMATTAAAQSDRRFEVIVDIREQSYLLREITSSDLSEIYEDEVISLQPFGSRCRVAYVEFDDGDYTNEGRAKFRIGHAGWQYGGKIVLLDDNEQPYSVVVSRLSRTVELIRGDVELLTPKRQEDLLF